MELHDLLNIVYIALGVAFVGAVSYLFLTREAVRKVGKFLLPWVPKGFEFLAAKFPDQKGVFDKHDLFQLAARVSTKLAKALTSGENKNLEDLKDDVRDLVLAELQTYKDAGLKDVPDLDSEEVEKLVDMLFDNVKTLLEEAPVSAEDQSGNDQ